MSTDPWVQVSQAPILSLSPGPTTTVERLPIADTHSQLPQHSWQSLLW